YPKLLRWIEDFQRQRGRSVKGAARDWYAKVYLPAVDQLKERRLLRYFPGRSVGDLFVYLGDHKWIMSKAAGRDIGMRAAVDSFVGSVSSHQEPGGFARWLDGLAALVRTGLVRRARQQIAAGGPRRR